MIKIGWSQRDVSTNAPVMIPGQFHRRISKGCLDAITVTALVIEREDTVIMVSGDFVTFRDAIIVEIRDAVRKRNSEIPAENILLNATHTHTSPAFADGYKGDPYNEVYERPEIYREFLVNSIADAVAEAYERRGDGSIAYGVGTAAIGSSRRSVYFDDIGKREAKENNSLTPNGHGKMYGSPNDEMFSGYEGASEPNVNFLFTFDKDEELTGAIINLSCPAQCGEQEFYLSADFWHFARRFIREKYGNIYILPQCSAAGDLSPHPLHYLAAQQRELRLKYHGVEEYRTFAQKCDNAHQYYVKIDYGEKIANAFSEVYPWASKEKLCDVPVLHKTETMPLEALKITKEQYEDAKEGYERYASSAGDVKEHLGNAAVKGSIIRRYKSVIERYEENAEYVPTEIHTVRIGDVAFASNPFELYIDYQHRMQGRSPFVQTFIVQLAAAVTDKAGYLCTERALANKGYSAIIYSCHVSPKGGQTLVNKTLRSLNELYEKKGNP